MADVYQRLRGDYVRNWIAKPTRSLPYTPMPVVIPYAGQAEQLVPQTMYHGTPTEQLDGVVDLLMNYDRYTAGRATIKDMVKQRRLRFNLFLLRHYFLRCLQGGTHLVNAHLHRLSLEHIVKSGGKGGDIHTNAFRFHLLGSLKSQSIAEFLLSWY